MNKTYLRLLILTSLLACLNLIANPEGLGSDYAAPCIQDCEASENMCYDSCAPLCSTTDSNCNNCISNCQTQFQSCMRHAIWCDVGPVENSRCYVGWADHCPIINNEPRCDDPSAHSGYYEICNTIGGIQCISCPDHEYCIGSNGLPPCF